MKRFEGEKKELNETDAFPGSTLLGVSVDLVNVLTTKKLFLR